MALKILIATPNRVFGEQIFEVLDEAKYHPLFTPSTAEAAFILQYEKCPIAILDCELSDPGPAYLAAELRAQYNDLRIIFVKTGEASSGSIEINPARDIILPRPFFLPDLLEVIHLWVAEKKAAIDKSQNPFETQKIPSELTWLRDVNQAAQYLTRLSLEVDAQAALIIRDAKIWAYAGQLSQTSAEELAKFTGHHWANGDGNDLARFVHLETTDSEYMLYATSLGSRFVLALSFETEMPFSKIRSQTGEFARKLISAVQHPHFENNGANLSEETSFSREPTYPMRDMWVPESDVDHGQDSKGDWNVDETLYVQQQGGFENPVECKDALDSGEFENPPFVTTELAQIYPIEERSLEQSNTSELEKTGPLVRGKVPPQGAEPLTRSQVVLEPESYAMHDLAFSIVLIPRLSDHHLTGILTGLLNTEMARLCLAFGWRLEHLAIRPQYLYWVVSVTPDVPVLQVIHNIREQTSNLIFNEFPRLAKENPSGDFWAPGFLTVHGRQSLTGSIVQDFIQQTRVRQGFENF